MQDRESSLKWALELLRTYMLGMGGFKLVANFIEDSMTKLQNGEKVVCTGVLTITLEPASPKSDTLINAFVGRGLGEGVASTTSQALIGLLGTRYGEGRSRREQLLRAYCDGISLNRIQQFYGDHLVTSVTFTFGHPGQPTSTQSLSMKYAKGRYYVFCPISRAKSELEALLNSPQAEGN
jgi:hypothetical protein